MIIISGQEIRHKGGSRACSKQKLLPALWLTTTTQSLVNPLSNAQVELSTMAESYNYCNETRVTTSNEPLIVLAPGLFWRPGDKKHKKQVQ